LYHISANFSRSKQKDYESAKNIAQKQPILTPSGKILTKIPKFWNFQEFTQNFPMGLLTIVFT